MLCSAPNGGNLALCPQCLEQLPWHQQSVCPQCALPVHGQQLCGDCLRSAPAFDHTRALFRYAYPLNALLQQYKYQQTLYIAKTFSTLLADTFARDLQTCDCFIPMPLHPRRLAERGFNQSLEIARLLAKKLYIPLDTHSCKRIKFTPPQASLPLKTRVKNMRGAFSCETSLAGAHVILVDDVMTTGASLHALAKTVKAAGATHVECWVIARTLAR